MHQLDKKRQDLRKTEKLQKEVTLVDEEVEGDEEAGMDGWKGWGEIMIRNPQLGRGLYIRV